jgi:hypothetical protein
MTDTRKTLLDWILNSKKYHEDPKSLDSGIEFYEDIFSSCENLKELLERVKSSSTEKVTGVMIQSVNKKPKAKKYWYKGTISLSKISKKAKTPSILFHCGSYYKRSVTEEDVANRRILTTDLIQAALMKEEGDKADESAPPTSAPPTQVEEGDKADESALPIQVDDEEEEEESAPPTSAPPTSERVRKPIPLSVDDGETSSGERNPSNILVAKRSRYPAPVTATTTTTRRPVTATTTTTTTTTTRRPVTATTTTTRPLVGPKSVIVIQELPVDNQPKHINPFNVEEPEEEKEKLTAKQKEKAEKELLFDELKARYEKALNVEDFTDSYLPRGWKLQINKLRAQFDANKDRKSRVVWEGGLYGKITSLYLMFHWKPVYENLKKKGKLNAEDLVHLVRETCPWERQLYVLTLWAILEREKSAALEWKKALGSELDVNWNSKVIQRDFDALRMSPKVMLDIDRAIKVYRVSLEGYGVKLPVTTWERDFDTNFNDVVDRAGPDPAFPDEKKYYGYGEYYTTNKTKGRGSKVGRDKTKRTANVVEENMEEEEEVRVFKPKYKQGSKRGKYEEEENSEEENSDGESTL